MQVNPDLSVSNRKKSKYTQILKQNPLPKGGFFVVHSFLANASKLVYAIDIANRVNRN